MQSDIGLIGLAVMGQNLALNIADHGFAISVYNRTTAKTDEFIKENPKTPGQLSGYPTIKEFAASLKISPISAAFMPRRPCMRAYASQIICISPYSIPLWIILT